MEIPKINFDSVTKFYLSASLILLTLAGYILFNYTEAYYPENIKCLLMWYFILFGVAGIILLFASLYKLNKEGKIDDELKELSKQEKEIDVSMKKYAIQKEIEKVKKQKGSQNLIDELEKIKKLYDKEKETFYNLSNLSATTATIYGKGMVAFEDKSEDFVKYQFDTSILKKYIADNFDTKKKRTSTKKKSTKKK